MKSRAGKLTANSAVHQYLARHYPDILDTFQLVVNTVSMEQAVADAEEAGGNGYSASYQFGASGLDDAATGDTSDDKQHL